ncbi:MAG: hypothetical protein ABJA10_00450, partial [Aestuariivirga sp.]
MWANLKAARQNFQPILTGWLVVALLLPAFLGVLPSAQAASTGQILQSIDLQLCSHLGHSDDGKGQPGQHDHDCPCCLPVGTAQLALPVIGGPAIELPKTHFTPVVFSTWFLP